MVQIVSSTAFSRISREGLGFLGNPPPRLSQCLRRPRLLHSLRAAAPCLLDPGAESESVTGSATEPAAKTAQGDSAHLRRAQDQFAGMQGDGAGAIVFGNEQGG